MRADYLFSFEEIKRQSLTVPLKLRYQVRPGQQWGKLECLGQEMVWMRVNLGADGAVETTAEILLAVMRCHGSDYGGKGCRRDFWIMLEQDPKREYLDKWPLLMPHKFPGKRVMRDCGCMSRSGLESKTYQRAEHQYLVAMPQSLKEYCERTAKDRQERPTEIMREMVTRGLRLVESEGIEEVLKNLPVRGMEKREVVSFRVNNLIRERVRGVWDMVKGSEGPVVIALIAIGRQLFEDFRSEQRDNH